MNIFSSCCQFYELVSNSKIYHVEKLKQLRKKYKKAKDNNGAGPERRESKQHKAGDGGVSTGERPDRRGLPAPADHLPVRVRAVVKR